LLRAVAGASTAAQGGVHLSNVSSPGAVSWVFGLTAIASGASLVAGFMTPVAGAVAAIVTLSSALNWSPMPSAAALLDPSSALLVVVDAAALVLLGPGAHSTDALLFGRREILIPHEPQRR
jgi:uncharacterized membrane protein YphA (DoxX/SURF4 family)